MNTRRSPHHSASQYTPSHLRHNNSVAPFQKQSTQTKKKKQPHTTLNNNSYHHSSSEKLPQAQSSTQNLSRYHACSLSPVRVDTAMSSSYRSTARNLQSNIQQSMTQNMNSSQQLSQEDNRIMVRQQELIDFTKKFAIEKADYEDKIDALEKDCMGYRNKLMRAEEDISRLSAAILVKQQNDSVRNRQSMMLRDQKKKLADQVSQITARLEVQKKTVSDSLTKKHVKQMQELKQELRHEIDRLKQIHEKTLQEQKKQYLQQINELKKESGEYRAKLAEAESLLRQVHEHQDASSARKSSQKEASATRNNNTLKNQLRRMQTEKEELETRIYQLQVDVKRLSNINNMFETELKKEQAGHSKTKSMLQSSLMKQFVMQCELQRRVEKDNEASRNQNAIGNPSNLKISTRNTPNSSADLPNDLTLFMHESQVSSHTASIQDLKKKLNLMTIEKQHIEGQLAIETQLRQKYEELQEENRQLQAELKEKNKKIFQLTTALAAPRNNNNEEHLTRKCLELEAHIERLNSQIVFLETQLYQEQQQLSSKNLFGNSRQQASSKHYSSNEKQLYTENDSFSNNVVHMNDIIMHKSSSREELKKANNKIKLMETIMESIKSENDYLKHNRSSGKKHHNNNNSTLATEVESVVKDVVYGFQRERMEMEQEIEELRHQNRRLNTEVILSKHKKSTEHNNSSILDNYSIMQKLNRQPNNNSSILSMNNSLPRGQQESKLYETNSSFRNSLGRSNNVLNNKVADFWKEIQQTNRRHETRSISQRFNSLTDPENQQDYITEEDELEQALAG